LSDLHGAVAVRGNDEVASLARSFSAMMQALDERMETNQRLYDAAQARVRELSGLAEIARLLTAASSLQETLDELSAHVGRLVEGSAVAIVLQGEGSAPNVHGGWALPDRYAAVINSAMATSSGDGFQTAPEMALRSGKVAWRRVADIPEDSKPLRDFAQAAGWGATLGVPLRLQDRTIGALAVYTASDAPPSEMDISLLMTIADQVAVVVENARLQEQARNLAAVQERQRLARELHDSVSQALYGIALGARTARTLLERDPHQVVEPLDYVLTLAEAGMAEMRALIFELRPEALQTEGLVAALEKQVAFVRARHGIAVTATMCEEPAVPYGVKEALYRIGQEALHNTVKHAHARQVDVRLNGSDACVVLEVADDGVGFHPDGAFPGHLGLHTMRERAVGLGGTLHVESAPGSGTRIRAEIPR
jgi:signal transduction histidine kinase